MSSARLRPQPPPFRSDPQISRADSLIVFTEYLAAAHPEIRSLTQLTRAHVEGFLAHNHKRPWRLNEPCPSLVRDSSKPAGRNVVSKERPHNPSASS